MTCVELQESLAEFENGSSAEQLAHLKSCQECSALVQDLVAIATTAAELRSADEPSPRVWNSIEIALRQEGLIRPQRSSSSLLANRSTWSWGRWLVPAAALLAVAIGLRVHQQTQVRQIVSIAPPSVIESQPPVTVASLKDGLNDDDLLQEVSAQEPAMKAQYADNLQNVNQYIRDAQGFVDANPNDEEARRSLLEAYQQKAMLFELAMDRSLP